MKYYHGIYLSKLKFVFIILFCILSTSIATYIKHDFIQIYVNKIPKTSSIIAQADTKSNQPKLDNYFIMNQGKPVNLQLPTLARWSGTGNKIINYKSETHFAILNAGAMQRGGTKAFFKINVGKVIAKGVKEIGIFNNASSYQGIYIFPINEPANYEIEIEAENCEWWVRIAKQ